VTKHAVHHSEKEYNPHYLTWVFKID
jgi:hypothetical protein